ncbi:MAG: ATP-binding protein [Thermoleophilia bacterium]
MSLYTRSLRQKLFLGYITGVVVVFAFVLLTWSNLSTLQEMVHASESVSGLFDSTLEIRRFEKNYFLYRTDQDYRELLAYINQAEESLNQEDLLVFTTPDAPAALRTGLHQYSALLKSDTGMADSPEKTVLEEKIREKGKEIVTAAEAISADRNRIEGETLQSAKQHLIVGVVLILAAGFSGGLFFYSKGVKPLSVLEKHMQRIADGEFSLIPARFTDRELISLKAAFNKMLIELQDRQQYLVESEKSASLGTLVFGVAHELNNPLSNISTSSQILKEEIGEDDIQYKRELISQIESETERARDVVSSLLEFSRNREKGAFSLEKAVAQTIRFMKAEIPANVRVDVDIPAELEVFGDRQKIQQMLLNLIKNATDAIADSGTVRVSASKAGDSGGMVEIMVRDDGAGMQPEQMKKIFNPFFTSKTQGYGLGLFIVHNVVEEHGGTIEVESDPGQGTTFIIQLPVKEK